MMRASAAADLRRRCAAVAGALLLGFGLGACGLTGAQEQATAAFGNSAAHFGGFAATALIDMRERALALDLERYRYPGSDQAIASGAYRNLGGALTTERTALRLRAANALKAYGQALLALLAADSGPATRAAGAGLVSGLQEAGLPGAALGDQDAGSMEGTVSALSGLLTSSIKREALERLVPEVKPKVDVLCSELGRDLDRDKAGAAAALNSVVATLLTTALANVASADPSLRFIAVADFARARDTEEQLVDLAAASRSAAASCLAANAAMAGAFAGGGESGLVALAGFAAKVASLEGSGFSLAGVRTTLTGN